MAYNYPRNIFDAIRQERQDFLYNQIEIVPGFTFQQYENIKKIHKYYNSHYVNGDYETVNGVTRKRVFWNIGKRRATIASKQIDIDTKDFLLISEDQATEWNVFLLNKELKAWMDKDKYAKVLKQISEELPVYGSCVLRKTKDGAEVLDLRYFFCEQSADNLKKSRYKIIKHFLTPEEMRKMKEWNHVQEAINEFATQSFKSYEDSGQLNIQHGTPYIEVYERYAEVPRSFLTNDGAMNSTEEDDDFVYARFICAGVDAAVQGSTTLPQNPNPNQQFNVPGIILFSEELAEDEDPFKEVHWSKTKGRWQGIGIIEETFEDQRMLNKTKDQEDKAMELASLIIFQTAQDMVARSILTDVDNGEIIKATAQINRLDNTNKALPEMNSMAEAYENHADLQTFSADLLGGQETPGSATLGAVKQQNQNSTSVYTYKREIYGNFLEEFIQDLVFPDLEKKIKEPHVLRFQGDLNEMNILRQRVVDGYLREQILKTGIVPTQQEYQELEQKFLKEYTKMGSKMWIAIEKDFFANIEYEVSLETTGESQNVQQWLNNLQQVFTLVSANPMIMQNPLLKRLLYKMLSAMGMSISELENADSEVSQELMQNMIAMGVKKNIRANINMNNTDPNNTDQLLGRMGVQPAQQPGQGQQQPQMQGQPQ